MLHFVLAYYLGYYLKWDMIGISIASCIHFMCRFGIAYGYVKFSGKFDEGYVPLSDPDCFKNWKT